MKRFGRYCAFIALGLMALLLVGVLVLKVYLGTGSARQLASNELTKLLGSDVQVTDLGGGLGSTTATIAIPAAPAEAGSQTPAEPLVAGTIRADVSPVGLAMGSEPRRLTLENARLTLRFNAAGDLIDRLPEPRGADGGELPSIRVQNATIRLAQEGKPDFVASGIDGELAPNGSKLKLTGAINDPFWSRWTAAGEFDTVAGAGSITLETEAPTRVTPDHLRAVPFVPPETWKVVTVDGTTPCRVRIGRTADRQWTWHVLCRPRDAKLNVAVIDLATTDTSGEVVVDGPKVTLRDVRGRTAGGDLSADAVLDFGPTPSRLTFDVRGKNLAVTQLPKGWGFPSRFREGTVAGQVGLVITVQGDDVRYSGHGEGLIRNARGLGYSGNLELKLHESNNRLVFDVASPANARRPEVPLEIAVLTAVLLQTQSQQPSKDTPAEKQPATPEYVQANLRLKDVDLAELIAQLDVKLPVKIGGRVSLDVSAEIPVSHPETLRHYRARGSLTAAELRIDDLVMKHVAAELDFRDGVLSLTRLAGDLTGPDGSTGTFVGSARFGVEPRTDLTADLKLTTIPLDQVFAALPGLHGRASGPVSGSLALKIPGTTLRDVSTYSASGRLTTPGVSVFGRRVEKAAVTLGLDRGVARIADVSATIEGLPVAGSAAVTLTGQYPFEATLKTTADDAVTVHRLIPEADLPFELTAKIETSTEVRGTLNPVTVSARGQASATGVKLGTAKVEKLDFDWELTERVVELRNLRADLYQGGITGSARLPLADEAAGSFGVAVENVDSAALTRAVPSLPVKLTGAVSGTIKGTLPATKPGLPRQATTSVDLTSDALRVNGVRVTGLVAKVDYTPGFLDYKVSGKAAGGSIESEGRYPLRKAVPPIEAPVDKEPNGARLPKNGGSVRVRRLDLGQLAAELGGAGLAPVHGSLSLSIDYILDQETGEPIGSGLLEVTDFGWGRAVEADLRAAVRVSGEGIEVSDLTGRFAGGTLRGRARYNLVRPARSFYVITLDGADAASLLEPYGLDRFGGRFDVSARGNIGPELRGTGTLAFRRARVTGFDLADVRLPFDWSYTPGSGGRFAVRDVGGQAAGGRITGETTVAWGHTVQVDGRLRFVDLSMRSLLGRVGSSSGLGSSRMNGTFNFSGINVRSFDDVTGQLTAQIGQGPMLDTPVFTRIAEYLVPSPGARGLVSFSGGDLRARVIGGRLNIERLALTGPRIKLFLEGGLWLDRRVDLNVVATTGRFGIDPRVLRLFGLRVPALGPVPIGLILEVSNYLSNRTIRLSVTGTVDNPIVRVNVAQILGEEAVRYFLTPYLFGGPAALEGSR